MDLEFCLPVLTRYPGANDAIVLVDTVPSQAKAVAEQFGLQRYCTDFRSLPMKVDAAIVTSPHQFHAPHSVHFLRRGTPVFVEKPLAMSASEAAEKIPIELYIDRLAYIAKKNLDL